MSIVGKVVDRYRDQQNPLRTQRRVELACLLAALLLMLQLLLLVGRLLLSPSPEAVPPAAGLLALGALSERDTAGQRERAELLARPLFWPSRRPLEVAVVETERESRKAAPRLKGLALQGVFGDDETRGAIVSREGKLHRLLLGDDLAGWELQSVAPEEVVFSSEGRSQSVELKRVDTGIRFEEVPDPSTAAERPAKGRSGAQKQAPAAQEGSLTLGGRPAMNLRGN